MRPLHIAMPYYDNGGILREHVRVWNDYPDNIRKKMVVVIADDGSPNEPAHEAIASVETDVDIRIYRIGINIPWNHCGARNLAMHNVPDGWVLVTDIDHVLTSENAQFLLRQKVGSSAYYIPARRIMPHAEPYKAHPNSYYLQKSMYWDAGGCDEDFAGSYGSDSTFRRAMTMVGFRVEWRRHPWLLLYGRDVIPDASTTAFGRKDSAYHVSNRPELQAKKMAGPYKAENPLRFPWERVR